MKTLFLILFLSPCIIALSQSSYAVFLIPDTLIKKANAVTRLSEEHLEIKSAGRANYSYKIAYTILNENGAELATQQEYYDKFRDIRSIDADLYDAMGKKIKSLKNSDIQDLSGNDNEPGMSDNRNKQFGFYYKNYPYTVEFRVEISMDGLMFLPNWYAVGRGNHSVEKSSFEVSYPSSMSVKYKTFNYSNKPSESHDGDKTTLRWDVKTIPPMQKEASSPPWYELTPCVFLALQHFEMGKYEGSMETWESLGNFVYKLKQGRDELPPTLKAKVAAVTSGLTTTKQKVAALYQYMQQNSRYVSVQLGIGGWQPFDAGYVYDKKFGDCKALTNYMYALLKEAGIHSIYTLVKAGRGTSRFIEDFPTSQFNHVILCVPNVKDTIWLECTSQTMPPGYLGDFTCDRPVLLVEETGSRLIRTPKYTIDQNTQHRSIRAKLDAEGNLAVKSTTRYMAMQQDFPHALIHHYNKEKQLEYLKSELDIANYDIKEFSFTEAMADLPSIDESLDIVAPNYAQITGKRCFVTPNILTKTDGRQPANENRKYELVYQYAYRDIDSAFIDVPEGYVAEALPKPAVAESVFGKYQSQVTLNGNQLVYTRVLNHYSGRFPPTAYPELVKFYDAIYKADRAKVVLVKKE